MKITTPIDDRLLQEAMRATRAHSTREVIELGLQRVLAEVKHRELVKAFGSIKIQLTHDALMRSRE